MGRWGKVVEAEKSGRVTRLEASDGLIFALFGILSRHGRNFHAVFARHPGRFCVNLDSFFN